MYQMLPMPIHAPGVGDGLDAVRDPRRARRCRRSPRRSRSGAARGTSPSRPCHDCRVVHGSATRDRSAAPPSVFSMRIRVSTVYVSGAEARASRGRAAPRPRRSATSSCGACPASDRQRLRPTAAWGRPDPAALRADAITTPVGPSSPTTTMGFSPRYSSVHSWSLPPSLLTTASVERRLHTATVRCGARGSAAHRRGRRARAVSAPACRCRGRLGAGAVAGCSVAGLARAGCWLLVGGLRRLLRQHEGLVEDQHGRHQDGRQNRPFLHSHDVDCSPWRAAGHSLPGEMDDSARGGEAPATPPRTTPCSSTASRAYSEHVGANRHAAAASGDTSR